MTRRIRLHYLLAFVAVVAVGSLPVGTGANAQGIRLGKGLNINLGSGLGGSIRRVTPSSVPSRAFDTFYRGSNNSSGSSARISVPSGGNALRSRNASPFGLSRIVQAATGLSIGGGTARTSPPRGGSECILNPHPTPPRHVDPVVVVGNPTAPPPPEQELTAEEQAREHVLAARMAFEKSDYSGALKQMDEAVELVPKNQDALQFRSLILFAMQDYKPAAAEAYNAILLGPIWTWETVRDLYPVPDRYSEHYRRLQQDAKADREAMDTQFLLAYHHLVLGHLAVGEKQLRRVLKIQPEEPVTQQLLEVVVAMQAESETKPVSTP